MDGKDHGGHSHYKNNICSLEWIAWAIDAARRHKKQRVPPARPRPMLTLVKIDCARR